MNLNEYIASLNDMLYGYILIILLVAAGVWFTIRSRCVQIRLLPEGIRLLSEKGKSKNSTSSFQALMISTASRVGTGIIAGVATALAAGGPGSIAWMWLLAIIGGASAFVESTLAQIYKVKDGEQFRGGPAYYIQKALGMRKLGIIFAVLLILCFAFGFNALQAYNVSSAVNYYANDILSAIVFPIMVGLVLAVLTGWVIFGGIHRIGIITSYLVPLMALLYILVGLYISFMNFDRLFIALQQVFRQAFDFQAIAGGFAGSCVMYGMKRGLFSNEAGMGSAPNAGATADVTHPAKQGMVQTLSVFIDTLLICTTTAFMLLVYEKADPSLSGMPYVQMAVSSELGEWGIHFITISIFLFAFSSLIGNYSYAESNLKFINENKKLLMVFRIAVILSVYFGAQADFDFIWNIADLLMGLMALVNIVVILFLHPIALRVLRDYEKQKKEGKDPVFEAKNCGIDHTDCW